MEQPTVIVSDIHLGAVPGAVERVFHRFLRAWRGRARTLLINGDLFDFWFEYRTVVPAAYFETLRALAELRDSGVRLILVGGNHDAWGGRFLADEIGLELLDGPVELELSGRRALVAHGDGLAGGDLGYRMLRAVIRSRPACAAMRWVHPDWAARLVRTISRTGGRTERDRRRGRARSRALAEYGERLLSERPELDLVVFAHCHMPELRHVDSGRYYINSGDWVEHRTYTLITRDRVDQREWLEGEPPADPD